MTRAWWRRWCRQMAIGLAAWLFAQAARVFAAAYVAHHRTAAALLAMMDD